jgi:hypothetical protein
MDDTKPMVLSQDGDDLWMQAGAGQGTWWALDEA